MKSYQKTCIKPELRQLDEVLLGMQGKAEDRASTGTLYEEYVFGNGVAMENLLQNQLEDMTE